MMYDTPYEMTELSFRYIVDFFNSKEVQKEFEDWKKKQTEDKKE